METLVETTKMCWQKCGTKPTNGKNSKIVHKNMWYPPPTNRQKCGINHTKMWHKTTKMWRCPHPPIVTGGVYVER